MSSHNKFRRGLLNPFNEATSDAGFSVRFRWPETVEYREGNKLLKAYLEMLSGRVNISLDSRSIRKWESPFSGEPITAEKRQQILEGICEAASFLGIRYVVR
jgi:hypothetical protein